MSCSTSDTFIIKRGDNAPSMAYILKYSDGVPEPLTGSTVYFHFVETTDGVTAKPGATINTKSVTVTDAAAGKVRVDFSSSDTLTAKRYIGEFEVRNGASYRVTFPNQPNIWVHVVVVSDLKDGA